MNVVINWPGYVYNTTGFSCCVILTGVGTYMLELLHDLYPEVYRFAVSVYPSADNDVITSPYNSILGKCTLLVHIHSYY